MHKNPPLPLKSKALAENHNAAWRRVSHGGMRFAADPRMRQPQDGAVDPTTMQARVASITSKLQPAMPQEPEDARLTGSTRSLYRRLMGLNVTRPTEPPAAVIPAATAAVIRTPQRRPSTSVVKPQIRVA